MTDVRWEEMRDLTWKELVARWEETNFKKLFVKEKSCEPKPTVCDH